MRSNAFATIRDFSRLDELLDGMVNVGVEESAKLVMRSKTSFLVMFACESSSLD